MSFASKFLFPAMLIFGWNVLLAASPLPEWRELPFEDEAEFQKFLKEHKKEIADAQVEVREK